MLFNLILPKVERLAFWNPLRRPTGIRKDKLNWACCKKLLDIFAVQRSPALSGRKTIVPSQLG
jgi:hypothetical protein